jgi:hypothetical protein
VVAAELGPLSTQPLPEIPPAAARAPEPVAPAPAEPDESPPARAPAAGALTREPGAAVEVPSEPTVPAPAFSEQRSGTERRLQFEPFTGSDRRRGFERRRRGAPPGDGGAGGDNGGLSGEPRSSRLGGAILLGAVLLIVIAVVIIVLVAGGGNGKHSSSSRRASSSASSSASQSSSSARPIASITLSSPSGNRKVAGVAIIVRQGNQLAMVIRGQGLPANTGHDAYAVWLGAGPGGASHFLGFDPSRVAKDGVLQTEGVLPANASSYKQLLVTLETQRAPRSPGTIVLQGAISLTG